MSSGPLHRIDPARARMLWDPTNQLHRVALQLECQNTCREGCCDCENTIPGTVFENRVASRDATEATLEVPVHLFSNGSYLCKRPDNAANRTL